MIVEWRDITTGKRAPLVIGGTYTQVLADIMTSVSDRTYGDCYCYLFLALTEKRFLFLYNNIYCTLDKVFITQSSKKLKGSDATVISVYTNEETNPWVQMQLETFYLIDCVTLTSGG